jgi:hypothetical protein
MQRWANFIAKHPAAHVLLGRTRNVTQWRNADMGQLVAAQRLSGKFSVRRDLDAEQGYLLIIVGFENASDASGLARSLGAKRVDAYGGYGTVHEFDPALLAPAQRGGAVRRKSSPFILGGP